MASRTSVALVSLFALACSGAAEPPAPVAPVAPAPVIVEPARPRPSWLYEIRTGTQPSYVFAALDPGCPLHECFPADYLVLFRFARQVIVLDPADAEEARASMLARGLDRSGSLERTIGPERFAALAPLVDDLVSGDVLRFFRPVWALLLLSIALSAEAYGVDASDGRISPAHDAVSRRETSGAPILGLFDSGDFDHYLAALSPVATDTLSAMLEHLEEERAAARALLVAYRAGDDAAMLEIRGQVTPGTERATAVATADARRVLDESVEVIETELRTGNALVVLPFDMVLGEQGLLARLRTDGFEISRVSVVTAE
jgi:hypothetical protein